MWLYTQSVKIHSLEELTIYKPFYISSNGRCNRISIYTVDSRYIAKHPRICAIGRASLARENEAGGSWGQEIHILHVNI